MKKMITRTLGLALVFALLFNACKKADMPGSETTTTENGTLSGKAPSPGTTAFSDEPTGVLEVTEEQFNQLNDGQYLEAKLVAPHSYVAGKPIPWPWPSTDPCAQDLIDYTNFMNTWHTYMVNWANAHCMPFRGCWTGPRCGICITYQVNPTRWCGDPVRYDRFVKVFE